MLHHKLIAGEIPGTYLVTELINEEDLLTIANQIVRQKLAKGIVITDKYLAQQALQTLLQSRDHEVFAMLFLDNQHRILAYEELFRGTLSSASVYPREVVKSALAINAAALMLVHYVARHIMHLMCPVSLCAPRGGAGHISRIYGGILAT